MERIVALFDTHVPFNINLQGIFEFVHDFKPTLVILGGDMHDWTAVCHWIADQSRHFGGETIMANYAQLKQTLLSPVRAAIPRAAKMVFIPGNHEFWLQKAIELIPNGQGYWELEKNIDKGLYDMKILKYNEAYQVNDNLCYIHGLYTNEYHAKKTVLAYHTSVIYGHVHTIQSHVLVSPVNASKFYKGQAVGCLCNLNPHYMENKPNAWVNGFSYAYVDNDGTFEDYPVVIVKNKFWALGRRYK